MYSLIYNKKQVIVIKAIDRAQLNNENVEVEDLVMMCRKPPRFNAGI